MIRGSRGEEGEYQYETITVVLATEIFKLLMSIVFHFFLYEFMSFPWFFGIFWDFFWDFLRFFFILWEESEIIKKEKLRIIWILFSIPVDKWSHEVHTIISQVLSSSLSLPFSFSLSLSLSSYPFSPPNLFSSSSHLHTSTHPHTPLYTSSSWSTTKLSTHLHTQSQRNEEKMKRRREEKKRRREEKRREEKSLECVQYRVSLYYGVPAIIYSVYNLLMYLNLSLFSPTNYRVLINIRVLWYFLSLSLFLLSCENDREERDSKRCI